MRGKAKRDTISLQKSVDHPRLCGEKQPLMVSSTGTPGSPPPMRGKVPASPPVRNASGITPAYAGKSCSGGTV